MKLWTIENKWAIEHMVTLANYTNILLKLSQKHTHANTRTHIPRQQQKKTRKNEAIEGISILKHTIYEYASHAKATTATVGCNASRRYMRVLCDTENEWGRIDDIETQKDFFILELIQNAQECYECALQCASVWPGLYRLSYFSSLLCIFVNSYTYKIHL